MKTTLPGNVPGRCAYPSQHPMLSVWLLLIMMALTIVGPALAQSNITLVSTGAVWKYLDNGTDPGSTWANSDFDDGAWSSATAKLGYGHTNLATVVSFGAEATNKYVTTYFRQSFVVAEDLSVTNLFLRLQRQDGVRVFLNGTELFRNNLPSATTNLTLASDETVEAGTVFLEQVVDAGAIVPGTNWIAAEVHLSAVTNAALIFELDLTGNFTPRPLPRFLARWPAEHGGNGHAYEAVLPNNAIMWPNASNQATNRGGYLASITSADEGAVIFDLVRDNPALWNPVNNGNSRGPWLGGVQPAGSTEPDEGWSWLTGEPFTYENWANGEPSDDNHDEDRIALFARQAPWGQLWQARPGNAGGVRGYIVEYESLPNPAPLLEFLFNETGTLASNSGSDSNATSLQFRDDDEAPVDLHSSPGAGVSTQPGDRAFDNTESVRMAARGGSGIQASPEALQDLASMTILGWMKSESGGLRVNVRVLFSSAFEVGPNRFGTLGLQIPATNSLCRIQVPEIGQWIFFAFTYDGSISNATARAYKATLTTPVRQSQENQFTNYGILTNALGDLIVGNWDRSNNAFDGWLDNIRIFGSKTGGSGALSLQQLEWFRTKDVLNLQDETRLTVGVAQDQITLSWPVYPGGFQLESTFELTPPDWSLVVTSPVQIGNMNVFQDSALQSRFFRLRR